MTARPIHLIATVLCLTAWMECDLSAQSIRVGENFRVASGFERRPLVEPHVAAHPNDPRRLIAATIVADAAGEDTPAQTCAAFVSEDAGRTWERRTFAITHCYDPWVAITPGGDAVFATLGAHPKLTAPGRGLLVFHSPDGGRTWNERPTQVGHGRDHPTIAVDPRSPDRRDWIYVSSTEVAPNAAGRLRFNVAVARSRDGGRTFEGEARVLASNLNLNAEHSAVLSDGSVIVSFVDTQRRPIGGFSEEGGDLERRRAWVLRSTDGGRTFSVPLFATEACAIGWTAMAADQSAGPRRDRVYFACREKGAGAIVVTSSADSAETWTDPIRASSTPRARTEAHMSPFLAVNKDGVVAVAWVAGRRVARASASWCHTISVTASIDGGRTFLPPAPISAARSCPSRGENGAAYNRWPYGGDYFGMTAAADGRFHVVWADARTGVFQLWTAAVEVVSQGK